MRRILAVILLAFAASCMAQQAQVRIDVDGTKEAIPLVPVKSDQRLGVYNPDWADGKKAYYLSVIGGKVDGKWAAYEFSFVPGKSGIIKLVLMGPPYRANATDKELTPVWVAYDNLTVTGAELKNPDFENINGRLDDWNCYSISVLEGQSDAQSGKNYVKAWQNQTVWQVFEVKKDQQVTVKFYVRNEDGEPSAVSAEPAVKLSTKVISGEKVVLPKPSSQPVPLPERELAAWRQAPEEKLSPLRSVICLDGWWKFAPLTEQKNISWGYIRVPGSWASSQGWEYYAAGVSEFIKGTGDFWKKWNGNAAQNYNMAFYERTINIPESWRGRAVILDFVRVSTDAKVYVNDIEAGSVNWPDGQVDITTLVTPGKSAVLTILVQATPNVGDVLTYWNTADSSHITKSKAVLLSRGLIGDVMLIGRTAGAHIDDVFVKTSWREHKVSIEAELVDVTAAGQVKVTAVMLDESGKEEQRFTTTAEVKKAGRQVIEVSWPWANPRLWDLDAPNLYTCRLAVTGAGIKDEYAQEFGFRETWIEGKQFKLNGSVIRLRPTVAGSCNTEAEADGWIDGVRAQGYNFGFLWAKDLGVRSTFDGCETLTRRADRKGFLMSGIALDMSRDINMWNKHGIKGNYEQRMTSDLRRRRNHPSCIMWGSTANYFGSIDDYNPRNIGRTGYNDSDPSWKIRADRGAEAIAMIRKYDPTRPVFTHSGSYVGDFNASNIYLNLIPLQEREDYLSEWAKKGERPFFACEFEMPCDLTFHRVRTGYPAPEHSEPLMTEFCAGTLGREAYVLEEDEYRTGIINGLKKKSDVDPKNPDALWKFRQPKIGPQAAFQKLVAMNIQGVWRAWRTWGISGGMVPWTSKLDFKIEDAAKENIAMPPFKPGTKGMYLPWEQRGSVQPMTPPGQTPYPVGAAFQQNNSDLLAWITGPEGAFTSKDHSFTAGRKIQKQAALLNDSRTVKSFDLSITANAAGKECFSFRKQGEIEPGKTVFIPFEFIAPAVDGASDADAHKSDGVIELSVNIGGKELKDCFKFRVFKAAGEISLSRPVVVLDPAGDTKRMLTGLGIKSGDYTTDCLAGGTASPLLIIGRKAFGQDGAMPANIEKFVKNGGNVLIMEQEPAFVQSVWGFRTCGIRARQVFMVNKNHPAVAGCDDEDLHDWVGTSMLVEPYPKLAHAPHTLPHYGYYWGAQGVVTTAAFEKPHLSGWTPILECEFDLQYSPLMELGIGSGKIILSALDLEDHWSKDAAAAGLARNIIAYAASGTVPPSADKVVYVGNEKGEKLLKLVGAVYSKSEHGEKDAALTILGPGADLKVKPDGRIFILPDARPELLAAVQNFHGSINVPDWPQTRGLSPSDLRWRVNAPAEVIKPDSGFETGADGLLARSDDGKTFVCQVNPGLFDVAAQPYLRFTRWRQTRALSQLLANQGVSFGIDRSLFLTENGGGKEKSMESLAGMWKAKLIKRLPQSTDGAKLNHDSGVSAEAQAAVKAGFDDSRWEKYPVGGNGIFCESYGGEWKDSDGESVFRRTFEIPAGWAGKELILSPGCIDDTDTTYIDGVAVGSSSGWNNNRIYTLPAGTLAPGRHTIAVRVWDQGFDGGLRSPAKDIFIGIRPAKGYYYPDYRDEQVNGDDPYRVYPW